MTLDDVQIITFEPGLAAVYVRGRQGHSIGKVWRDGKIWTVLRSEGTYGTFRTRRDAVEGLLRLLDGKP
jgi:hypothetical protein